ncbi:MAG TPA: S8 family serine peptidase, partial [Patescibacteria group bacterium]|nr:S8 family serine peptidase [Patescibacteria group bacterium]
MTRSAPGLFHRRTAMTKWAAPCLALLLAPVLVAGISSAAGPRRSKAMVPRSRAVEALASSGRLEILEDYGGSMVLVRGSDTEIADAEAAGPSTRGHRRIDDRILLRARTIDPAESTLPAIAPPSPVPVKGRLEILQFHGPVKESWLKELRKLGGARPIAYVPHNAYIVWVEDPAALAKSSLPVQWREPLALTDRLSPELTSTQDPVDVTVQIVRAGAHDAALDSVRARALAIRMEAHDVSGFTNIRVTLPPGAIEEIARLPEVAWIEPFGPIVTHDERSDLTTAGLVARGRPLGPGYLSWLAAHGLDDLGGIIVDITDTGIDIGGTQVQQPGLKGRVAYSDDLTGEGLTEDCVGHGTNIAGIIAGGVSAGNSFLDDDGYLLGLGVAPSVRIGVTRIFDCAGRFFPGSSFTDLIANAYRRGARIGNNSWGGPGTQYNSIDAEYDALVRDADGDSSNGSQGFLPVFSSGNLGPNPLTVGWPATAKNVLTVGATENYRPVGADGCGTSNLLADSVDHVLTFSSRGPTGDGRIKPELVAPGSHIQSLASTAIDYTGIGVCNPYYPPGQQLLNWSSGTSQAAAHVTAAAVIAAEVYRRQFGVAPSPAMIKAMLIGHAHDMGTTTQTLSNTSNRPNFAQGWGRADIGSLVEETARLAFDQQQVLTATGQTATFDPVVAEDPSRGIVVTLAWTDAPGTPAGWAFVNDLDLRVEADGVTYLGNVLDKGLSVAGGAPDERNNVEMVVLPPGTRSIRVTVEAANLAGDGVPTTPGETDQDFALHVTNARLATDAGFIEITGAGRACGALLTMRLADRQLEGFGRVTADVESGADRETVTMDEDPPGSGVFSGSINTATATQLSGDGVLQAVDGQAVTASYHRLAPGTGAPQTLSATIVARCAPPVLTQIEAALVGDGEATIRWKTDRPADSQVSFGLGATRTQLLADSKLVTEHEIKLRALAGCSFYTAVVSSTDAAGLGASGPASPLGFSTGPGTKSRRVMLHDDMEALGTRWTHGAMSAGAVDDWQLGHASSGPPGAFSGTRVWGTNLDGNYSVGADAALISPPVDLRDVVGAELTFEHYYAITGGRTPNSLNDGAWVEISSDGGATWTPIEPAGGYPDTIDEDNPYLSRTSRVYAGVLTSWSKASFDLSTYSGHIVRIRFHFWQDPSESNATLSGWYIDDVEMTAEGICHQGRISLDGDEYGCSSRLTVTLSDSDLNLNQLAADTAHITAASPLGQQQINLVETGLSTGQFRATLDLSPAPAAGKLAVAEGAPVSFTYADANTGGGTPATATASAMVSDCTAPPAPTNVTAKPYGAGTIRVTWTPVDPAAAPDLQGYRIWYDTDGSGPAYSGTTAFQGVSPVRVEASPASLVLTALGACSPHFITVTSFDRFGNESAFAPEGFAVPDGSSPCAAGHLTLAPQSPGCRQSLSLSLSDANADPDPATAGKVIVSATGPSHAGALP